jgi:hypothetical protein
MQRLMLCLMLLVCAEVPFSAQTKDVRYKVSFPHINLKTDRGERIESIAVVMHCGRFVALNSIPDDWSATIVSPVSEKTTLRMEAGHGTSELWHSEDLDEFVTVLSHEDPCFDIAASITAIYYEGNDLHKRKISFRQNELILKLKPQTVVKSPSRK